MGIFEKNEGSNHSTTSSGSVPDQINMVGNGTVFEGTLKAESDVRVSGTLIGTLDVNGRVLVAEEGSIEGDLNAMDADIAGNVQGKLEISGRLLLKGSARIEGEIHTERLIVEEGAHFSGTCHMGDQFTGAKEKSKGEKSLVTDRVDHETSSVEQKAAEPQEKVESS